MLIVIFGEADNVAEQNSDAFEAPGLDAVGRLQFFGDILWQDNVKQFFGALFFGFDLAEVRDFAIAQPFLLEASANARAKEDRIEGLGHVIFSAEFDAAHNAFDLVESRKHNHRNVS